MPIMIGVPAARSLFNSRSGSERLGSANRPKTRFAVGHYHLGSGTQLLLVVVSVVKHRLQRIECIPKICSAAPLFNLVVGRMPDS